MGDLTTFATLMADKYGEALLGVSLGGEDLTCKRCGETALPFCVELDTADQPHGRAAYCGHCMNGHGAAHIKFLPKDPDQRRRASLSTATRWKVFVRDGWTCAYCRRHKDQLEPGEYLHVDHIVPVADGGTDADGNITCACSSCNIGKSTDKAQDSTTPGGSLCG